LTGEACKHTLKFQGRGFADGFLGKAWLKLKATQINAEFRSKIRFMPNFPIGKPWQIKLLGSTALGLLIDEIENGNTHKHQQITFQPELIVRASTKGSDN